MEGQCRVCTSRELFVQVGNDRFCSPAHVREHIRTLEGAIAWAEGAESWPEALTASARAWYEAHSPTV